MTAASTKNIFPACDAWAEAGLGMCALPMACLADIRTLGGYLTGQDEPYACQVADEVMVNLVRALMAKS